MINIIEQLKEGLRAVDMNTSHRVKKDLMYELVNLNIDLVTEREDLIFFIDIIEAELQHANIAIDFREVLDNKLYKLRDIKIEDL